MGGNSIKASSGINAMIGKDDYQDFLQDTLQSAGNGNDHHAQLPLVETLVSHSATILTWLKDRVGVDLQQTRTRLGGHSRDRTHRPSKGTVGYSVMSAMQQALKPFQENGSLNIFLSTRVTQLMIRSDDGTKNRVVGVHAVRAYENSEEEKLALEARHVVLATGGFAADRGIDSYLAKHCPEFLQMPATFGDFSTGDGIKVATSNIRAGTCYMDKVQIHPTGFVDPADPTSASKILCAEVLRGIGGILVNTEGKRFSNELGTRAYVTEQMFHQVPEYAKNDKEWDSSFPIPTFHLVLDSASAKERAGEHIGFYMWKKLLQPCKGVSELAEKMDVPVMTLTKTLQDYGRHAQKGSDQWGKTVFPTVFSENLEEEDFLVGMVTPVLHYCMGGLTIDKEGSVLDAENQQIIPGLHAAGEVVGGVHGNNRLAGNSLLECLVFGRIIGNKIAISASSDKQ
jgi:flavocytochrome c